MISRLILPLLFMVAIVASPVWADGYFTALPDLPLPPGLNEDLDKSVTYETGKVRILDLYAAGNTTPDTIMNFYQQSLPMLGWQPANSTQFRRDQEHLTLAVTSNKNGTLLHISIRPQE